MISGSPIYTGIMLLAIIVGLILWYYRWRNADRSMVIIFVGALFGGFFGAKICYLLAEGWMVFDQETRWLQWLTGKTILGALLGGYAGTEFTKKLVGFTQPTGDWFAGFVPLSIATGRIGCLTHGCCLGEKCEASSWYASIDPSGIARWPAVQVELIFNLLAFVLILTLIRFKAFPGQLFHLYLIGYGIFRFIHEFQRATPRLGDLPITGYQIIALLVFALGLVGYLKRRRQMFRATLIA